MASKQKKKTQKKKGSNKILIIEGIIALLAVVGLSGYAILRNTANMVDTTKAVVIDGETFSVADVNYFYYSYYNYYADEYSTYFSYMIDETESLKEQEYEDGITWFDFFLDETIDTMISTVRAAALAEENGYTLSEDGEAEILDYVEGIVSVAKNNDVTADYYISNIYGSNMTIARYEELMRMSYLATEYATAVSESIVYSDDEVEAYYLENITDYTYVSYERVYYMAASYTTEPTDEEWAEALEKAEDTVARLEAGEALEDIADDYSAAYYATEDAYYSSSYTYGDWLFDLEREEGDVEIIADTNGYYVMIYRDRESHNYHAVTIRDIFIEVDTDSVDSDAEDYDTLVNELYEAACLEAEELREDWLIGGGTEDLFAELADKNTDTDGLDGGLYEQLTKDTLDSAIEDWCFDESRKTGDYTILYTDEGFHFLYFVKQNQEAWRTEADADMRQKDLEEWYEGLLDGAEVKRYEKALSTAATSLT